MTTAPPGAAVWPTRRQLLTTWATAALVLGALLVVAQRAEGPLDDPDQAQQRPGFLDGDELPTPAPKLPGVEPTRRTQVIFFERRDRAERLCDALADDLDEDARIVLVVRGNAARCPGATTVSDPDAAISEDFGLRRPRGGGPPVGYAVIDASGQLRYRTLDPEAAANLDEVATIVGAVE